MAEAPEAPPSPSPPVRQLAVLTVLAALVGIVVSLASWCFLELIHQTQTAVFTDLPSDMGYHAPPWWWLLLVLGVAGVVVALAIERLPGRGGHIPAEGLKVGGGLVQPNELPGIVLAGFATIALGLVLGPEAPLLALGGGLGVFAIRTARRDAPLQAQTLLAAAGSFAAMSFIFEQPLIAAVILLEALGLDRRTLPLVLIPGMTAAGVGSLVSIGMGSFTGLSTSAYALGALPLPAFGRPDAAEFGWTVLVGIVAAVIVVVIYRLAAGVQRVAVPRILVIAPAAGMIVAGLAIAFSHAAGKSVSEVLFSGQDQLPGLVSGASTWSISALLLLLGFKGVAWAISLGSFRGGPTFPSLFLGAAGGILASRLPGFDLTAAVVVCMGASFAAALRLPLSAVVVATLLAGKSGPGTGPLIIVGVVVAYLSTLAMARRQASAPEDHQSLSPPAAPAA
ncbi:MAG: chloride channel protein [Solirubrobacteraceae bacterium]